MTNREYYKEQILDVVCDGKNFGFDKINNTICSCACIDCINCKFNDTDEVFGCNKCLRDWANEEYVEPCPFEKDELVEVSDDAINWHLRYFAYLDNENEFGNFVTYENGLTSADTNSTTHWMHCRKYGTLGGLAKE